MAEDLASTLAVVVARLDDLRGDVAELRVELQQHRGEMVPRGEWMQRNLTVDQRFEGQGREIAELKAARAPWWSSWSIILAAGALAWTVLGPLIRR